MNANTHQGKCEFYVSKCCQHLNRTALSRNLALAHVHQADLSDSKTEELIRCSLGDQADGNLYESLSRVVTKTHFLLLKVEFELFLNRVIASVWECFFENLVVRTKIPVLNQEYRLKEFAKAVAGGRGKEYVITRIVPRHGLQRLSEVLVNSTGIACQFAEQLVRIGLDLRDHQR